MKKCISTLLSISNENEFRRTSANYANFGEQIANFWTSIVQVAAKFRELGEKVRRNFAVLNEIPPGMSFRSDESSPPINENSFRLKDNSPALNEISCLFYLAKFVGAKRKLNISFLFL